MRAARRLERVLPPMSRSLLLIEKWAHHRGDATSRGGGLFVPGKVEPVVRVHHGSTPIYVRDLGKCLMVLGIFEIPKEAREKLAAASEPERWEFLGELREILMSCPRVGFGLDPTGVRDPKELLRIVLDQTIQVAENDAASFNRFCDAIQETETLLLRTAAYVRQFVPVAETAATYSSSSPPPSELYL